VKLRELQGYSRIHGQDASGKRRQHVRGHPPAQFRSLGRVTAFHLKDSEFQLGTVMVEM
jgi:hypothetical protein